jgi:hypothetical protein
VSARRLGTLRAAVVEELATHRIAAGPEDTPAALRERLNEAYLEDVRRLREQQRAGEIPLAEYAGHVEALRRRYPLLALPLSLWTE